MNVDACGILRAALLVLLAPGLANAQSGANEDAPATEYVIREFTTGMTYPVISSSYDHHPQIELLPNAPAQRIIPFYKTPWVDDEPDNDQQVGPPGKQIKKFGGFDGISQTPWAPPDPTLAVGPNHILSTANMQIAWWTKAGILQFTQRLDSTGNPGFLEDVGAGDFTFDPKCLYDEIEGRFLVLALEKYSNSAYITLAVSDDSDPNGTWRKYRTDAKTNISGSDFWPDYPGFGYDDQAYYVTGNLFGFSGGWGGVKYRVFDKAPLLTGAPAVHFDLLDGNSASVQVASMHNTPAAQLFVSVKDSNEIRIQAITTPLTSPVLHTTNVTVPVFSSPPDAPNLGGGTLSTVDGRIMTVDFRDQSLLTGHAIGVGSRALARWYEFRPGIWPLAGSVTLRQNGDIDLGTGRHTWFPALARNDAGNTAIVMARSSTSEFASVWYTHREPGDALNSMRPARELKAGEGNYSGRWGDYFDIAVDPTNGTTFWGIGEYASSSGSWRTWIGVLGIVDGQVSQIGFGSPGTSSITPTLSVNVPAIGEPLEVTTASSLGGLTYYHAMSFTAGTSVVKGATIHVGLPWFLVGPLVMGGAPIPGLGSHVVNYPVPLNPALIGAHIFMQSLILDPGAPQGLAATPGVELTVGE